MPRQLSTAVLLLTLLPACDEPPAVALPPREPMSTWIAAPAQGGDTSEPVLAAAPPEPPASPWGPWGTWYLAAGRERYTLSLRCHLDPSRCTITNEAQNNTERVDEVRWDGARNRLRFRRVGTGSYTWFRGTIADGIFVGRATAPSSEPLEPADPAAFTTHVTGWKGEHADRDLAPRVYELLLDGSERARLRIDREAKRFVGRFKIYSSVRLGASSEQDEKDAAITRWDGQSLDFVVQGENGPRAVSATVSGRLVTGTVTDEGTTYSRLLGGARAEVLSHGFVARPDAWRTAWQARARRQLAHLVMAGGPRPADLKVEVLADGVAPLPSVSLPVDRDDAPAVHPAAYHVRELLFTSTIGNPEDMLAPPIERRAHGFMTLPDGDALGRRPALIALNGHEGSARKTLDPDQPFYWYGDGFARRGAIVLALDVGHRPLADRQGLYDGVPSGDDPGNGNGVHPAIAWPGLDSDWEEDGERAWDVMRAIDYLSSLPEVDPARIMVTGLSMGGEVATYAAALDPRVALAIPAGFSPDLGVLLYHRSHGCWQWAHGDVREYLDTSDLHALAWPRPLVVETGKEDWTYSWRPLPFAGDKQVLRRSRAFYADQPDRLLHYLHYDVHHFHAGEPDLAAGREPDVRLPVLVEPPTEGELSWQSDPLTLSTDRTLFQEIARLFGE